MRDPARLEVLERCAELAVLVYRVTASFPASEKYGLASQMRRAVVSVGSNIAEGCGMATGAAFLRYLNIATGSLLELDYQAMLASRLALGDAETLADVRALALRAKQMLSRLRSSVRANPSDHRGTRRPPNPPLR